ncbi:tyrosine-type recombinase/integrase [Hyphomicrobium facile]|uniref:Site-specific recombinase XerD n=1 Tax=Hyphomicrobium facile TaxID=51670 RepID=A0A1I7NH64_9HYPH|nr:tyrosine-type recombinase/integrase [Hyphomicrobium facile]SFV34001.1 Site-specific recombinase XerD [Hyphomicrobium facile]
MPEKKLKYLRWKGNQYQFFKRLPKDVAEHSGKSFHVENLGTADAIQARKIVARKLIELEDRWDLLRQGVQDVDVAIAGEYRERPDGYDKDTLNLVLLEQAHKKQNGRQWYRTVTGQAVTISFNVDRFLREAHAVETTQKARKAAITRFEHWLQEKRLETFVSSISRKVAGDFSSHLSNQGLAQKTVNGLIQYLSSYWKWMVRRGIAEANPWQGQQVSAKGKSKTRLAWSHDEVSNLLNNAPTKLLLHAIAIGAQSGLRAGEIAALRVSNCKDGVFDVLKGKTEAATRKVPIHSQLTEILSSRLQGRADEEFLFAELAGKSKGLVKRFAKYRTKLLGKNHEGQADKTFHSLRHTFITERLRANCQEYLVQAVVGHANEGVTVGVYHHGPSLDQLREVVEAAQLPSIE